ncbi:hypothetical protein [Ferrovibrio sp.]|uniref:hypothetical protein n=1 Tax=Ferrovibrio sp. TaxID=1917215 RepID=UPI0035B2441C
MKTQLLIPAFLCALIIGAAALAQTTASAQTTALAQTTGSSFLAQMRALSSNADADENAGNARRLATLFGGESLADRLLYRRDGDKYYAGLKNGPTNWFMTAAEAQGFLLRAAIAESSSAPEEARTALAAQPNAATLSAVTALVAQAVADTRVLLPRGIVSEVTLKPRKTIAGQPSIAGPAGLRVDAVQTTSDGLRASIAVAGIAKPGAVKLKIFAANHAFLASESIEAFITEGDGEPAAPSRIGSDQPAGAPVIQLAENLEDALPPNGGRNHYRLLLAQNGPVRFATSGASDTVIRVFDANGQQLGRDDDSGPRYNASLGLSLAAGIYTVAVEHCCAGWGRYGLSVTAGP